MRDVGVIIWVALLFIGVVGSMISSLRRQMPSSPAPPSMPMELPGPVEFPSPVELPPELRRFVVTASPRPAPQRKPAPVAAAPVAPPPTVAAPAGEHFEPARIRRRLFSDRHDLVRGVIAAEVLGKPRALHDEYHRG